MVALIVVRRHAISISPLHFALVLLDAQPRSIRCVGSTNRMKFVETDDLKVFLVPQRHDLSAHWIAGRSGVGFVCAVDGRVRFF